MTKFRVKNSVNPYIGLIIVLFLGVPRIDDMSLCISLGGSQDHFVKIKDEKIVDYFSNSCSMITNACYFNSEYNRSHEDDLKNIKDSVLENSIEQKVPRIIKDGIYSFQSGDTEGRIINVKFIQENSGWESLKSEIFWNEFVVENIWRAKTSVFFPLVLIVLMVVSWRKITKNFITKNRFRGLGIGTYLLAIVFCIFASRYYCFTMDFWGPARVMGVIGLIVFAGLWAHNLYWYHKLPKSRG